MAKERASFMEPLVPIPGGTLDAELPASGTTACSMLPPWVASYFKRMGIFYTYKSDRGSRIETLAA